MTIERTLRTMGSVIVIVSMFVAGSSAAHGDWRQAGIFVVFTLFGVNYLVLASAFRANHELIGVLKDEIEKNDSRGQR